MNKNKSLILIALAIFVICFSLGSVSSADNGTGSLNAIDDANSVDKLNALEEVDSLSQTDGDKLAISDSSSNEVLALSTNSSDNVLSTSVSVSSGHTFHKYGYTFKVSGSQYKNIKDAIKMGKKQKFLDWGFDYTVKTNKVIKVKVLAKKQTIYKKVRYEGLSKKTHTRVIFNNLNYYYNNGWQRYDMSYQPAKNSKKYVGYNYVHFKKTVKKYKTVYMRVYATISYVGEYDYETGQHAYFPWVSFDAKKSGYGERYLKGYLLTSY